MTFTTPPTKTNGVSNITAAEMNTYLRDNIEHLRTRPVVKIEADVRVDTASGVEQRLDLSTATELLDTDGAHAPTSQHLDLQPTEEGIWYLGSETQWEDNTTGDRWAMLKTSTSTTPVKTVARMHDRTADDGRKSRISIGTAFEMDSTDPDAISNSQHLAGTALDLDGTMWAAFMGGLDPQTVELKALDLTDSRGVTAWWNQLRDSMLRIYNRPAWRCRRNAALNLANASTDEIAFDLEVYDTASGVGADKAKYVVPTNCGGIYYCHASLGLDTFDGTNDYFQLQFTVNGTGYGGRAAVPDVIETSGDAWVNIEQFVEVSDGDTIALTGFQDSGVAQPIITGNTSHFGGVLISGDDPSETTNRQFFTEGLPSTNYDFTAPDSGYLPRGLANVMGRDYLGFLWNPPVLGIEASGLTNESLSSGGFENIILPETRFDNWGLFDSYLNDDHIEVPFDGVWLVVATLVIDPDNSGTTGFGDIGDRGMRIKHRGKTEGILRTRAGTSDDLPWRKTVSGIANASAGDRIKLQGLQSSGDELPTFGSLVIAWIRDKV